MVWNKISWQEYAKMKGKIKASALARMQQEIVYLIGYFQPLSTHILHILAM